MDRRTFLLLAAGAALCPAPLLEAEPSPEQLAMDLYESHVPVPSFGVMQYANCAHPEGWQSKTADQILEDINALLLAQVKREHMVSY